MKSLRRGICILRCKDKHEHGIVQIEEIYPGGPLRFNVHIRGLNDGKHGIHIHKLGNELHDPKSLCSHFNPTNKNHGPLNSPNAHAGDLGNIISANSVAASEFVAKFVRLTGKLSIYGRSIVVHQDKDDLGKGRNKESLKTGNSGKRILWGIIGVDDISNCG